jgi:formylglycine-generating enzyme required for sulfatase activity
LLELKLSPKSRYRFAKLADQVGLVALSGLAPLLMTDLTGCVFPGVEESPFAIQTKETVAVEPTGNFTPAYSSPLPGDFIDEHGVQMKMIPAGPFYMGGEADLAVGECRKLCADCDCDRTYFHNEEPIHKVYLDAFYIDLTEVTNAMYAFCMQEGACTAPSERKSNSRDSYFDNENYGDYPVISVSWKQAQEYCDFRGARLPTEAEWEKAARGGLEGSHYPWGDQQPDCSRVNFGGTSGCVGDTTRVGSYPSNGYGLFDMAGNVWEWVMDWYSYIYYISSPFENPTGPSSSDTRVLRGGSWNDYGDYLRVALREKYDPASVNDHIGFRCARSP